MTAATLAPSRRTTVVGTAVTALGTAALLFATPGVASAHTPVATGEWDLIAASNAQSPVVQSFSHATDTWDTVGEFAVGSGRVIDAHAGTPVTGGGLRVVNSTGSAATVDIEFDISVGDIVISDETGVELYDSAWDGPIWTVTGVTAGEFHEHYEWEFTGSTASTVDVDVYVAGAGISAGASYTFTF